MKPLVGILCSTEAIELPNNEILQHQAVFQKYINAVADFANCNPVLIPTGWSNPGLIDNAVLDIVRNLNGILLPGGASNVSVDLYSDSLEQIGLRDPIRDEFALSIIRTAEITGTPLLGICRGMQEINVAFGGTLITALHEQAGKVDHRSNKELPFAERYKPSHKLHLVKNSWIKNKLSTAINDNLEVLVNSLHGQGIGRLGNALTVDAFCEDGTVEAISHTQENVNIFGVQWHPEWYTEKCEVSLLVWKKFANSCRQNLSNNWQRTA